MKVLHITSWVRDGAGRACYRLHTGAKAAGHESRILSFDHDRDDELFCWGSPTPLGRFLRRLRWHLEARTGLQGLLDPRLGFGNGEHLRWADLVHLHNLHGYSLLTLMRLEAAGPWLWTFHDAWPLTGHCAYPEGCTGWHRACRRCPRPDAQPSIGLNTAGLLFRLKERIYGRIKPTVVCPSRWLLEMVRRSPLTARFRSLCIPNGVDTAVFRPHPQATARRVLGLPAEGHLLLFVASRLGQRRKGSDLLVRALRALRASGPGELRVVTVGEGPGLLRRSVPYPVIELGPVRRDEVLAMAYSAADLFVAPSREESFGLVLVESMACGTPCVAFRVGAVPEIVRPGRTGWLAGPEDPEDLARCIHQGLTDADRRRRMSAICRRVARQEYDLFLMTGRYLRLYEELIEQGHRAAPGRQPGLGRARGPSSKRAAATDGRLRWQRDSGMWSSSDARARSQWG